ncbi:hypothetical protein PoB_004902600 [Plakobranchus ocellatus]|uniref:Uncharacterized protein n=1 Tax=Plakobranchus ocellatus TaxID=259542 RepID=A0AAV4BPY9_9GAST|nr:hypothetical protein PoB_004902600 [Plakobranchus ocellatus]
MISVTRRLTFLWGALLFMVTMLMLYMMLDTLNMAPRQGKLESEMLSHLEQKLAKVEKDMNDNRFIVQQIKAEMNSLLNPGDTGSAGKADAGGADNKPKDVQVMNQAGEKHKAREEEKYLVVPHGKGPNTSDAVCQWVTEAKSSAEINHILAILLLENEVSQAGDSLHCTAWEEIGYTCCLSVSSSSPSESSMPVCCTEATISSSVSGAEVRTSASILM